MLSEALNYPAEGDDAITKILIGSFLVLLSPLLVPAILVYGYGMRILREAAGGDVEEPPMFENWMDLFVDGLKAFVVFVAYQIVPAIIAAVLVGGSVVAILTGQEGLQVLGAAGVIGGLTIAFLLAVALSYVIPAALVAVATTGRLGAGFAFGDLRPVLASGKYATGWLLGLLVWLVTGFLVGAINGVLPIVGAIPAAVVGFYALVSASYIYGQAYAEAQAVEVEPAETTGPESPA